tara:strand:+ start:5223 stop:5549 length:327 start_codon:yes stop_codon:yes gene_type:complete
MKKSNYSGGSYKNQTRTKLEPARFGKHWSTIDFKLAKGRKALVPTEPANQPLIGSLCIAGREIEITFSEANRIMETLNDAKHQYNVAKRIGALKDSWTEDSIKVKTYE